MSRNIVLVEYFLLPERGLHALAVRSDWPRPAIAKIDVDPAELRRDVMEAVTSPLEAWRDVLRRPTLTACVAPIAEWTAEGDVVCIVPAGPLFYAPLHATTVAGQVLAFRNAVFYVPSASALRHARYRRRETDVPRGSVFGDPDLPQAPEEAAEVARLLRTDVQSGSSVTKARFRAAATASDVIHFAGHARFDPVDPLASGLKLDDGILTAREIFDLDVSPLRLVVLSACETGFNDVQPGDELIGLTRSLLYLGAASLIVSLWRVADLSAAELMKAFYARWIAAGLSKVDALRAAQRHVYETVSRNPFHWASFILVGDWM